MKKIKQKHSRLKEILSKAFRVWDVYFSVLLSGNFLRLPDWVHWSSQVPFLLSPASLHLGMPSHADPRLGNVTCFGHWDIDKYRASGGWESICAFPLSLWVLCTGQPWTHASMLEDERYREQSWVLNNQGYNQVYHMTGSNQDHQKHPDDQLQITDTQVSSAEPSS